VNLHAIEPTRSRGWRRVTAYAWSLVDLQRFEKAKALLRKTMPLARRVLGESNEDMLRLRSIYAEALCKDSAATLADLREAVTTLAETERISRRLLGGAYPFVVEMEEDLRNARAALAARETPQSSGN